MNILSLSNGVYLRKKNQQKNKISQKLIKINSRQNIC